MASFTLIIISPFALENLTALLPKLSRIWPNRSGSPINVLGLKPYENKLAVNEVELVTVIAVLVSYLLGGV